MKKIFTFVLIISFNFLFLINAEEVEEKKEKIKTNSEVNSEVGSEAGKELIPTKVEEKKKKQKKTSQEQQIVIEEAIEIIGKIEKPQAVYIIPKAKLDFPEEKLEEETFLEYFNEPFEVIIE